MPGWKTLTENPADLLVVRQVHMAHHAARVGRLAARGPLDRNKSVRAMGSGQAGQHRAADPARCLPTGTRFHDLRH
jgi:hypothetical protein